MMQQVSGTVNGQPFEAAMGQGLHGRWLWGFGAKAHQWDWATGRTLCGLRNTTFDWTDDPAYYCKRCLRARPDTAAKEGG